MICTLKLKLMSSRTKYKSKPCSYLSHESHFVLFCSFAIFLLKMHFLEPLKWKSFQKKFWSLELQWKSHCPKTKWFDPLLVFPLKTLNSVSCEKKKWENFPSFEWRRYECECVRVCVWERERKGRASAVGWQSRRNLDYGYYTRTYIRYRAAFWPLKCPRIFAHAQGQPAN